MTLKHLAALQEKATKGDLSTAELVEGEDGCFDCPYCEGEGYVHGRQYINFDGAALNVMFSGIGDEHINWQNFFNAITKTDFTALCDEMERMRKALERKDAKLTAIKMHTCMDQQTLFKLVDEALGGKDE